jgi:hypothetical protein
MLFVRTKCRDTTLYQAVNGTLTEWVAGTAELFNFGSSLTGYIVKLQLTLNHPHFSLGYDENFSNELLYDIEA